MRIEGEKYGGRCQCGKEHAMATRLCVIESGALAGFERYMAEAGITGRRCAVYDSNTYDIPGLIRPAAELEIVLEADGLHADERSTARLKEQLEPGVKVIIAIGGGTIHDIVRYCAGEMGLCFVSVPTAASCDGFCSNVAAMTWHGYKKSFTSAAPRLVAADTDIIAAAPWRLTLAGVGDMLGKFIALADWRIAHIVTGEPLCPVVYSIMEDALQKVWQNCMGLKSGSHGAYEAAAYGLLMSGLAMQMTGSSRPASGGDHHISHFIEVGPAALEGSSDALHGEKVGVGTVIAAREYHRLAETEDISGRLLPYEPVPERELLSVFGERLFEACRDENKNDCLAAVTPEAIARSWPEIRKIIGGIPAAVEIFSMLGELGAKRTLSDIGIPEDSLPLLLERSPLIRNRLTLMRMRRMISLGANDR